MAQPVYILSAEEYSMFQGMSERIEQLETEKTVLTDRVNASVSQISRMHVIIDSLVAENNTYCKQIAEMKRDCAGTSKALAEARDEARAEETLRKDVQEELQHCREISDARLTSMHNLSKEVRRLKSEQVCIAKNPISGTTKVVSVVKADVYLKYGWTVSEPCLVERPA